MGKTRGETRRMCIAAAPSYLKGRVDRGEDLPQVEVMKQQQEEVGDKKPSAAAVAVGRKRGWDEKDDGGEEEEGEGEVRAAMFEHVVMEGQLPKELFYDLMDMLMMKWDEERRRG